MQTPLLFLGDIGGSELMLILVVILIFFGANKIPELARGLGKGIREFKDASREIRSEFENADRPQHPQQPYQQQFDQNYQPAPPPAPPAETSYEAAPEPHLAAPATDGHTTASHASTERPRLDQLS